MKKGSSTLIASIMAASAIAFTSSSGVTDVSAVYTCSNEVSSSLRNDGRGANNNNNSSGRSLLSSSSSASMEKEKFAPRFDGLKFIETLVTAHR